MNKIFFITGASGSGKTTAVKELEKEGKTNIAFCYFDSIGVPSSEEMIEKFGSGENWQKATTVFWANEIKSKFLNEKSAILDGQMRLSFIEDACTEAGVSDYEIILFDCNDDERKKRLIERGHSELANDDMLNWAKYLRNEALSRKCRIIDTSDLSPDKMKELLKEITEVKPEQDKKTDFSKTS